MAPFPYCFIKKQNSSILIYSTLTEELIKFVDQDSLNLIEKLSTDISVYKAIEKLADEYGIPINKLADQASELISYLKSNGIIISKELACSNEQGACLNIIGQMPGHFLTYLHNEELSHLDSPIGIRFQLTSACVVGCPHCYLRGSKHLNPDPKKSTSIPLYIIQDTINQLSSIGLAYVQLSGGEPCLHENFDLICELILDHGIPVYILTSGIGYDIHEKWKNLINHKLKNRIFVQVSIDDHNSISLNKQRPNSEITKIESLIDFLIDNEICVQSNTVITKDNYKNLENISKWIEQKRIKKKLFSICKPAGNIPKAGFAKALSVKQYLKCKSKLNSLDKQFTATFLDMPFLEEHITEKENHTCKTIDIDQNHNRIICSAGTVEAVITCNCSIAPCAELSPFEDMCIGNITQTPFLNIWNNIKTFYDIRNTTCCYECKNCNYKDRCGKGCHATKKSLSIELNSPDPYCFYKNNYMQWKMADRVLPRIDRIL